MHTLPTETSLSLDEPNPSSLQFAADCTPVTLPWSWDPSQGLRFPAWTEKSLLAPGKEIPPRSMVSCSQQVTQYHRNPRS